MLVLRVRGDCRPYTLNPCPRPHLQLSAHMLLQEGDYLELEDRDVLVLRVRGDGRKYTVSLRTDNWVVGARSHDAWLAFLFAPCAPPCFPHHAFIMLSGVHISIHKLFGS